MTKTDYEALVHFFRYRLNKKGRKKKKRRKIKTHRRGVLSKLQKKKKKKKMTTITQSTSEKNEKKVERRKRVTWRRRVATFLSHGWLRALFHLFSTACYSWARPIFLLLFLFTCGRLYIYIHENPLRQRGKKKSIAARVYIVILFLLPTRTRERNKLLKTQKGKQVNRKQTVLLKVRDAAKRVCSWM